MKHRCTPTQLRAGGFGFEKIKEYYYQNSPQTGGGLPTDGLFSLGYLLKVFPLVEIIKAKESIAMLKKNHVTQAQIDEAKAQIDEVGRQVQAQVQPLVQQVVQQRAPIGQQFKELTDMIVAGNIAGAADLIDDEPALVNHVDPSGWTALHFCAYPDRTDEQSTASTGIGG